MTDKRKEKCIKMVIIEEVDGGANTLVFALIRAGFVLKFAVRFLYRNRAYSRLRALVRISLLIDKGNITQKYLGGILNQMELKL